MRSTSCTSFSVKLGSPSGRVPLPFFLGMLIRRDGRNLNRSFRSASMMVRMRSMLMSSAVSFSVPGVRMPWFLYIFAYAARNKSSLNKQRYTRVSG